VHSSKKTSYAVTVHDIAFRPGEMREHAFGVVSGQKLGEGLVAVAPDTVIDLKLRVESIHEGILVSANVDTIASGICGRCVIEIEIPVEVEFQELFAYPSKEPFDYEVHDDHVNLEPLVRDAVVLALPFQPVCQTDCRGLDPETGDRLADKPEYEPRELVDPRWSALAGFQSASHFGDGSGPGVTQS